MIQGSISTLSPPQIVGFGGVSGGGSGAWCRRAKAEEEREEEEEKGCAGPVDLVLTRRRMWCGRSRPTPAARAAAGQRGSAAAPRRQTRPKGSSGANNICQELFLKIIKNG
jgi:hypothetical protein